MHTNWYRLDTRNHEILATPQDYNTEISTGTYLCLCNVSIIKIIVYGVSLVSLGAMNPYIDNL